MSEYLKQYLQYLDNTGHADDGLPIAAFDDDWEPVGPMVRRDLLGKRWTAETGGKIFLTLLGRAELKP